MTVVVVVVVVVVAAAAVVVVVVLVGVVVAVILVGVVVAVVLVVVVVVVVVVVIVIVVVVHSLPSLPRPSRHHHRFDSAPPHHRPRGFDAEKGSTEVSHHLVHVSSQAKRSQRRTLIHSTVGQNNQEYRLEYWATRSSANSFAHSLARGTVNGYLFCFFFYSGP